MKFFLGTHNVADLYRQEIPVFISVRRLRKRKTDLIATTEWAIDSGGFTELNMNGKWTVGPDQYIEEVRRYQSWGGLRWAAQQDYMCEPWVVEKTGLSIEEHQERTVENFLYLREKAPDLPFIPVLQGWDLNDYERCYEMFINAGVDLAAEQTVGIGSVCRRQDSREIEEIIGLFYRRGLKLHGFGVKMGGLNRYHFMLESADSMAWSLKARLDPSKRCSDCLKKPKDKWPKTCGNCTTYGVEWRRDILSGLTLPGEGVEWL